MALGTTNVIQLPAIPAEVRERIVQAANTLYEQREYQGFPPVDEVRRFARTDMNAASAVMREWRREQTMRAAPVAVQIPEAVAQANGQALAALWLQAQQLANESLQASQAGWEAERLQLDALRQEMAAAHDALAAELEASISRAATAAHDHGVAQQTAAAELVEVRGALASALARADRAEESNAESGRREQALKLELERERASAVAERERLTAEVIASRGALEDLRSDFAAARTKAAVDEQHHVDQRNHAAKAALELAERMTRTAAERDAANKKQAEARDQVTRLMGQLDALKEHNAALLRTLGSAGRE